MSDTGKTAVVTGAGKGIGAAIARRLASDGFSVIVNYASSAAAAEAVVADIAAFGGRAQAVCADVTRSSEVAALFDAAEAAFGQVDVIVNNAGLLKVAPLAQVTDEDFQAQISVNLCGTFNGMREGARRIRDGGRIISLSTSIIGKYIPAHGVYVATKAAIEGLTHVLAKELGPRGIAVNAVAPGPVGTEMLLGTRSEGFVQRLAAEIPMGRLGRPQDVAQLVSFLAGPDGAWVSSQIIRSNGGRN